MIFSVKLKRALFAIVACAAFLSGTIVMGATGAAEVYFGGTVKKVPIYSVERSDNKIAISFDCAYGADYTEKLLDIMDEYDVKCTFFCVEFWTRKFPDMVKKISARGHEIGTHSKTHPNMPALTEAKIEEELVSSSEAIESITGKKVELFRAPYGDYDDKTLAVAKKAGLYTVQWDVDSIDWKNISAKEIVRRVTSRVKSGSIILCHNQGLHTAEALPYILSNLKEKGFEFVPIGELIYKNDYFIDSRGVQRKTVGKSSLFKGR